MASDRPKRKAIPLRVKLASVMIALGNDHAFCIEAANDPLMGRALMARLIAAGLRSLRLPPDVDYDHDPALGLRPVNAAGDDYIPPQLHPSYITPRAKADHRTKTTGTPPGQKVVTVANGDIHKIAKAKRIAATLAAEKPSTIPGYRPDDPLPSDVFRIFETAELATRGARSSFPKGRKLQSRAFQRRKKP